METHRWGASFNFPENINIDNDCLMHRVSRKIAVEFVQKFDDYIVSQIAQKARESGIADLAVVDEEMALRTLQKQIPKKPFMYECTTCGMLVDKRWNFCPGCGQALDWGKENAYGP